MAINKTDLNSSIWASCDKLRGGMDTSQYNAMSIAIVEYVDLVSYSDSRMAAMKDLEG